MYLTCKLCLRLCHATCLNINRNEHRYILENDDSWFCCITEHLPFIHVDNDFEYKCCLISFFNPGQDNLFELLNTMVFNPFNLNERDNASPLMDADPDSNFFNDEVIHSNLQNCNYYTYDTWR